MLTPVVRIGLQRDRVVGAELADQIRAGSDGLGFHVVFGILVEDQAAASGERPQQVGVRRAQAQLHGVRVDGRDRVEVGQRAGVMVLLVHQFLDGPDHVVGVEFVPVGEAHALVEVERVGQSVRALLPAGGERGHDLVVLVPGHEAFVHVADEDLVERRPRLVADVQVGGSEFQPDGDGAASPGLLCCGTVDDCNNADDYGHHGHGRDENPYPWTAMRRSDAGVERGIRAGLVGR